MLELCPAATVELSVVATVEFYCKSVGRERVHQERGELVNLLSSVDPEAVDDLMNGMSSARDSTLIVHFLHRY